MTCIIWHFCITLHSYLTLCLCKPQNDDNENALLYLHYITNLADRPIPFTVYALIIVVHITVLSLAVPCMGWIVLFMGLFGFLFLLYIYSAVACSNPGMVLKMAPDDYNIYHQTEEERFQRMQELAETGQLDYVNADVAADVHVEAGESEHENGKGKETDGHHDEEVEDVEAEARAITIAMTSVAGVCVNVDEGKDVDVVVGIGETGTGANAGEETTIRHMRVHDDDNESSDDSFNNASQHRASQALLWKHNAGNISTNLGINSNGTTSDTSTSDCKTSNNGNGEVNIVGTGTTIESISGNNINVVNTGSVYDREVPCGHCQFSRPIQARHCTYCGCCIEGLDHHCPWSGKCIGNNNIRAFHWFVGFVCFEIYFMGGIFVYYLAACKFDASIPTSPIT